MSADIEIFQAPTGQAVRTVLIDDEPWFVAADICVALDHSNASMAVAGLDDDEKGLSNVDTPGGPQSVTVVNEPGLYSLILRSRKPEAKAFKRWITHEVLPAIRKTGHYDVAPQHQLPQTFAQALRELASTVERAEQAETALAIAEPKADAWDVLASSSGDYSVREAAFILNRDPAIDTGQNRLFAQLRELGLVDRSDRPYQSHAQHVRLRAMSYEHPHTREQVTTQQVRITTQGVRYLHRKLGGIRQPAFNDLMREVAS